MDKSPKPNPWLLLLLSISLPAIRIATERLLQTLESKVQSSPLLTGSIYGPLASPAPVDKSTLTAEERERLQDHLDRS